MDPDIMRLAQEQMSKMPPAELARIQQQLEALECFASHTMGGNSEGNTQDIEAIFQGLLNPFSTATATQTWLQEGVAYHLASNFRLSLEMLHISSLLSELPCWAYRNPVVFPELLKHDDSGNDQDKHQIGKFREKLNVLLFACNNGLLFLGYQLLQGIIFWEHEVDKQHKAGHSTLCPVVFGLIVKANKELFYAYSRYVVCCHLSDFSLTLLSGRASPA